MKKLKSFFDLTKKEKEKIVRDSAVESNKEQAKLLSFGPSLKLVIQSPRSLKRLGKKGYCDCGLSQAYPYENKWICLACGKVKFMEQPKPKENKNPAVWDLVMKDIATRDRHGFEKYGVRLQPFNGRDTLRDLYEELLDAVVYIRSLIYEKENPADPGDRPPAEAEPIEKA